VDFQLSAFLFECNTTQPLSRNYKKHQKTLNYFNNNKNNVPNIIVIKDALINDEFNSPNFICIIIGNIMETPSMICKIPSVKKTVL